MSPSPMILLCWEGSFQHTKHMLKQTANKIFTIIRLKFCKSGPMKYQYLNRMYDTICWFEWVKQNKDVFSRYSIPIHIAHRHTSGSLLDPFHILVHLTPLVVNLFYKQKHRGSYMSAHVLFDLLNELGKRDKMRGLPSILSLFRNDLINLII